MQSLLEMFATGVQDVEELQGRLQLELSGLEARPLSSTSATTAPAKAA